MRSTRKLFICIMVKKKKQGKASQKKTTLKLKSLVCVQDIDPTDRLLVVMALLRLNLLRKKVLLFVNTVDAAYKLRLLLEAFGQKAAVLNAELPLNSRHHIIQQFNKDLFDVLIATDSLHSAHDDKMADRHAPASVLIVDDMWVTSPQKIFISSYKIAFTGSSYPTSIKNITVRRPHRHRQPSFRTRRQDG